MRCFYLEANTNSLPWAFPGRQYQTKCVVIARDEPRARRIAATRCGEESQDPWLWGPFVRVEELSDSVFRDEERIVMSDGP